VDDDWGMQHTCKEKRHAYKILQENLKEKDHLEDVNINGRIILKWTLKDTGWEGMGWVHLTQDR
jgi:hypothetical protein